MKELVGITTTVPVEVILAAGLTPVDLNNRFITDADPAGLVRRAEEAGLARTLCAWIKGIYAWCLEHPEVGTIIAVTQGDCSNTHALMELLTLAGRRVVPFDFPFGRRRRALVRQLEELAGALGTGLEAAEQVRRELLPLRRDLARLDELTWREERISGWENHIWQLNASDFEGDPRSFHERLRRFLEQVSHRPAPPPARVRLGLVGVPPIMADLHQVLEELGGRVVFNEVPRQFAMPPAEGDHDLVEQYLRYSYPYDVFWRIRDIAAQVELRGLEGLVHYTQSFCFRQIQDMVMREQLRLPMLTLEGDRVGPVDPRTRLRLEAFVDVIR